MILRIDIILRSETDWVLEIHGFLGILNILGQEHLMVITALAEVCKFNHRLNATENQSPSIYELQDIELVPLEAKQDIYGNQASIR